MVNSQKLRVMPDSKSADPFRGSDRHRASCFLRPRQFRRVWGPHNLPSDFQDKMTEEDTSPKFTPALTTSSHETVIAPDDPFLHTPNKADAPNTSALSSFLFPGRSFEIEVCRFFRLSNNAILISKMQQFANIKDVVPEWDDDEVDVSTCAINGVSTLTMYSYR